MATCPHGFPVGQCLICQTLGTGPATAGGDGRPAKAPKAPKASRGTRTKEPPAPAALLASTLARPAADLALTGRRDNELSTRGGGRPRRWGWALVAAVIVGGVAFWAFGGLVHLALHIAELVAVGAAAGWVGYRLGQVRGRHQRRTEELDR